MKEPPRERRPRTGPAEEIAPPAGPRDSRLDADAAPPRGAPSPASASPAGDDALALPEGAWLALRRSGGLLFSSREAVLYPDGRVVGGALGGGRPARVAAPRALTAAQLAGLRRALERIDFARLPATGRARPDAYAYELVVRADRARHAVEVFDGSIPPALAPLLRHLTQLLLPDE